MVGHCTHALGCVGICACLCVCIVGLKYGIIVTLQCLFGKHNDSRARCPVTLSQAASSTNSYLPQAARVDGSVSDSCLHNRNVSESLHVRVDLECQDNRLVHHGALRRRRNNSHHALTHLRHLEVVELQSRFHRILFAAPGVRFWSCWCPRWRQPRRCLLR